VLLIVSFYYVKLALETRRSIRLEIVLSDGAVSSSQRYRIDHPTERKSAYSIDEDVNSHSNGSHIRFQEDPRLKQGHTYRFERFLLELHPAIIRPSPG
jgi:hypothetical protein